MVTSFQRRRISTGQESSKPGAVPIQFSKLLGSDSGDSAEAVAVDANSNIYVAGSTGDGGSFPDTSNSLSELDSIPDHLRLKGAFVTKHDATGGIVYSALLDAQGDDRHCTRRNR